MCRRRDTKSSDSGRLWYRVGLPQYCYSRQKVHVLAEMDISIVNLIPGGDPGDKRTVAFGVSENSRP